jgi:hypothetical protein
MRVSLLEEPLRDNSGMPILQLLEALQKYHRLRDFSHQERFGRPDQQSRQALSELGKVRQSLSELTSGASGEDPDFIIEASLNVRMAPARA